MYSDVPHHIKNMLQGEPVDFIVQSSQDLKKKKIGFVLVLLLIPFSGILTMPIMFMFPLFEMLSTGKTRITVNGVPQTYTGANFLMPLFFALFPFLIALIFIIPLVGLLLKAIQYIRKKGAWYAGTNKNLIEINEDSSKYYHWEDFENQITSKTHKDGIMDIILTLKHSTSLPLQSQTPPLQNNNIHISGTSNAIDLTPFLNMLFMSHNQIGLIKIPNGSYILNLIRHNMERYVKT